MNSKNLRWLDNDCDGQIDESLIAALASNQKGVCERSRQVCQGAVGWQDPSYQEIINFESTERSCDGLDNDCDGQVDESLNPPLSTRQKGVCAAQLKLVRGQDPGLILTSVLLHAMKQRNRAVMVSTMTVMDKLMNY